jgi:arsenate reductase (thioredoxin)
MAEAVARQNAADVIEPASAGLVPLGHIERMTTQTLAANAYAVQGLRSKPIASDVWQSAEIVINMSGTRRHVAFKDCAKVEDWDVEDPYGADQATYQRILDDIVARVSALADRLRERKRS